MRKNTMRTGSVGSAPLRKGHGYGKRRVLVALFAAALIVGLLPASASAHRTGGDLRISTFKAPVAPDGTTAGAALDFVVQFKSPNPKVDGVEMKEDGTITIELDPAFDLSGNQGTAEGGPPTPAIILQGWPQSPRLSLGTFPWDTKVDGNTITLTMTEAWPVDTFGPGPKAVHLALLASTNPTNPGRYKVDVAIQPDPNSSDILTGNGRVRILRRVPASVNVVSLFSGLPPGPPPLFNPLYQEVALPGSGTPVGMYLWNRGGAAAEGVDLEMVTSKYGRLVQDGKTVGGVWIRTPRGARNQMLESAGPSTIIKAFVTGVDTGKLVTTFTPDPTVAGDYSVTFWMRWGNRQTMRYHVTS